VERGRAGERSQPRTYSALRPGSTGTQGAQACPGGLNLQDCEPGSRVRARTGVPLTSPINGLVVQPETVRAWRRCAVLAQDICTQTCRARVLMQRTRASRFCTLRCRLFTAMAPRGQAKGKATGGGRKGGRQQAAIPHTHAHIHHSPITSVAATSKNFPVDRDKARKLAWAASRALKVPPTTGMSLGARGGNTGRHRTGGVSTRACARQGSCPAAPCSAAWCGARAHGGPQRTRPGQAGTPGALTQVGRGPSWTLGWRGSRSKWRHLVPRRSRSSWRTWGCRHPLHLGSECRR
jgi:hypothetical protein